MRYSTLFAITAMIALGCARSSGGPTVPTLPGGDESGAVETTAEAVDAYDGPYRLWGEWTFFFNAEHDRVDVVPRRQARMHLNVLVKLEEYCKHCLEITGLENNGDGTVDLTVRITHPFPGLAEYTGFDVKGIIMFDGSYEVCYDWLDIYELPNPTQISWRELGDPEVLSPDGYTARWTPDWEYAGEMPIFRYWEGKYASGVPNGDLNAYLNFYTHEERHMFTAVSQVERTYTIWLPPGEPVVAAYAVEACWEPPLVVPVTDPLVDFPITANQPEPYHLKFIINNGEPITDCDDYPLIMCEYERLEMKHWAGWPWLCWQASLYDNEGIAGGHSPLWECDPPEDDVYWPSLFICGWNGLKEENVNYRELIIVFRQESSYDPKEYIAYDVYDYTIDYPD